MTKTSKTDVQELSYEQAREELIQVVSQLEQGGLDLDASITLWERGESLIVHCQTKLQSAAERIAQVLNSEGQTPKNQC